MSYHVEDRFYPEFEKAVEALPGDMVSRSELTCPKCGGRMAALGSPDERYMNDGTFESEDRYYCDNCCTFADVTQVYAPVKRFVYVKQDVFDD